MVYYIGSLRKIRFNRNILYCKFLVNVIVSPANPYLIETFCIVNDVLQVAIPSTYKYLIETFCIVNLDMNYDFKRQIDI